MNNKQHIHTLLLLVLNDKIIQKYNYRLLKFGLCTAVSWLEQEQQISCEEASLLQEYIDNNRPSKWSSFNAFLCRKSEFYWPIGDKKSRIKWLKKHVKRNS